MASKLIKKSIFIEKNLLSLKKKDDDDDDETVQRLIASNKNGNRSSATNHSHAQILEKNSRGSNQESLNVR